MAGKLPDPWADWMAAERAHDADRADRALVSAMQSFPRREPSAALSARLMKSAVVTRAAAPAASERLVAAGVVAGALAMTLLPVAVIAVLLIADAGRIVSRVA